MGRRSIVGSRKKNMSRINALAKVATRFKSLRPAVEVLTNVRAVPTIFPDLNRMFGVGGYPIERFCVAHGPSAHGKTSLALGLLRSFVSLEHYGLFIDAERTTPIDWVRTMMGEAAEAKHFLARRPTTYEATREEVRFFLNTIAKAKDDGEIPEDVSALIVVDSLKKLVPANLWNEIFGEKKKGEKSDGLLRRLGQVMAAMNSTWLMELVPLLERSGAGFLAIAREMENSDGDQFSPEYKVGGGQDIIFDSSAIMRVERASWIREGDDKTAKIYGEKHRVTLYKTKIAGKEGKTEQGYFHTSNGIWVSEGFDRARDVLELAEHMKVIESNGAWFSHDGQRLGQGRHNAVKALAENPKWMSAIELQCVQKYEAD